MADHTEKQFMGFADNLSHIRDELYGVCDMRNTEITRGNPLEQLKFANISSVFPIIRNYLSEKLGPQFEEYFPCLSSAQFFTESPTTPMLVQTKHHNCLTTIFSGKKTTSRKTFIFSLSCSKGFIESIKEKAKIAIEEGSTLILFYTPAAIAVTIIEDIFEMIVQPHKDFRLIILCSSFKNLPQTILMGSSRINYDSFPSIRHIMFKIFSNNEAIISGSSLPQFMKKLSFSISMNYALTKARRFFTPLGTYIMPPLSQVSIHEMLERTSKFIDDLKNFDIPFLNLQERYNTSIIGAHCLDKFDIIKLQEETSNLLTVKWFDNTISFRGYSWYLDREWDVSEFLEVIQKMPIHPSPTLLGMDPIAATPIFNWRMSIWIAEPLAKMAKVISFLPSDVRAKLESLATMIPSVIEIPNKYEIQTPLSLYLLDEINKFNDATREINYQISNAVSRKNEEVFDFVAYSRVPPEWKNILGYTGTDNITRFFSTFFDKSRFLLNWLKLPTTPNEIDLRHLSDISGFFEAYHTEVAMQRGVPREAIKLQFTFQPTKEKGIGLVNVVLMGANWDTSTSSIIKSNPKTQSFTRIPLMSVVVVSSQTPEPDGCVVPLLKNIPTKGYTDKEKPFENHIANAIVDTTLTQQELILTGVAFICNVHDKFC